MAEELIIEYNLLPELAKALEDASAEAVKKAAEIIASTAVANAPEDTGFLKSSIYVVTKDSSTYGQAMEPPQGSYLLPEVDRPQSKTEAAVAVGANYGIYQEMGTRFMPAHPYWFRAVASGWPRFQDMMSALESRMKAKTGAGG